MVKTWHCLVFFLFFQLDSLPFVYTCRLIAAGVLATIIVNNNAQVCFLSFHSSLYRESSDLVDIIVEA